MPEVSFNIEVHGGAITVMSSDPRFGATYYKPSDKPHLCLRHRTYTEDHELLAQAFQAAVDKARELGWSRAIPSGERGQACFPKQQKARLPALASQLAANAGAEVSPRGLAELTLRHFRSGGLPDACVEIEA